MDGGSAGTRIYSASIYKGRVKREEEKGEQSSYIHECSHVVVESRDMSFLCQCRSCANSVIVRHIFRVTL